VVRAVGWIARGGTSGGRGGRAAGDLAFFLSVSPLQEVLLSSSHLHAVHLEHECEQLRHPYVALKKIRSILRPGGELIIAVPNGNSVAARLYRHFWFALDIPRHPFTYTRASLLRLLGRYGFRTTAVVDSHALGSIYVSLAH